MSEPARQVRVDSLTPGDFIEIHDKYGEVVRVRGPHGPLGTPPTTDWYTLGVRYDRERHDTTVGPLKSDREVVCWS